MRYFVTEPIPNGYAYYDVRDHESNLGENFSVATFWRDMPGADKVARDLCMMLNEGKL